MIYQLPHEIWSKNLIYQKMKTDAPTFSCLKTAIAKAQKSLITHIERPSLNNPCEFMDDGYITEILTPGANSFTFAHRAPKKAIYRVF